MKDVSERVIGNNEFRETFFKIWIKIPYNVGDGMEHQRALWVCDLSVGIRKYMKFVGIHGISSLARNFDQEEQHLGGTRI